MQKTNLNISPIFDDYDEDKNFYRVLFEAGKAVQARELTQAQTILQSQVERMGKHLFAEGAMVVPGGIHAISNQDVLKLTLTGGSLFTDFSTEDNLFIKNNATGMIYQVGKSINSTSTDPVTLFVDYLTPGSAQEKVFHVNDASTLFVYADNGTVRNIATATIAGVVSGAWVKVQKGVYFVRGMFITTEDQDYVVSKYTTDATLRVGFIVNEQIVSSSDDASLLSNANGFVNQNAPGAARLKITLTLSGLAIGGVDANFIELARFVNGSLQSVVDSTDYALIEDAIARRTYETNGDYVVTPFGLDIKEDLLTNSNGGLYTLANGGDETKLDALIKPGIGYVKGYRVQNIGVQDVQFDKARDTAFLNNASQGADYGQYFLVASLSSLPSMDIKKTVTMLDSTNVQVGTCRIRALRKDGTNYRVYVFDLAFVNGKAINNVTQIRYTDSGNLFSAVLISSVIYDGTKSAMIFPLPVSAVKTLYSPGIGGDTSYVVSRSYDLTTSGAGVVTASTNANETFDLISNDTYFVAMTGPTTIGTQFLPTSALTLGGNPNGTTITINLGSTYANQAIRLVAPVIKNATTQKTKTLQTVTDEAIAFVTTNTQKLTKADVYKLIQVKDATTSEDITAQFIIDNGQKDGWYESSKLLKADSNPIIRNVKVTYQYFQHSAGDYFSIDSYTGMVRGDIPSYNGQYLADAIDFRPLKDSTGAFTSATVFGETIRPGNSIRADVTYYLPRKDLIVAYSDGTFGDVRGESSLTPTLPDVPYNALKLYELTIPAYTYSPSDVIIKAVDNRRYTMRDIGALEARIATVEYYTSLSLLEAKTNSTQVIDPVTGNNRFKNGFAVDGFHDFGMADVLASEWAASLDLVDGLLQPEFVENGIDFQAGTLTNVVKPTKVFLKAYTETVAIDQPYATTTSNINPFAVFTWVGKVSLNPDRDFWKDVKYTEPVVTNNVVDLTAGHVQGTVWNSWIDDNDLSVTVTPSTFGQNIVSAYESQYTTATTTTINSSSTSSSTDQLLNTEVAYYMRSIPVAFSCTGFRPYTHLYAFFDAVSVSSECQQTGKNKGDPIITDINGSATGVFTIPNRADMKFKTGTSVLAFTDSATSGDDRTTSASTIFTSSGSTDTRLVTTSNTQVLTYDVSASTTKTTVLVAQEIVAAFDPGSGGDGGDPIAQTFTVTQNGGAFITKIDAYFATKSTNIPVTLELRTATAGLPTTDVIAYATLNPSAVNVSVDGSVATSFVFPDPVYLEGGTEYAIVLKAETQDYNVYIAEQGQAIIGSQTALSKQAYIGVFLTSSNASTWSPDQTKDLKFTVHRAVFNVGTSTAIFNSMDPVAQPLGFNALATVSGSGSVVVTQQSHGLKIGDSVTIAGAVNGNGLTALQLNGVKTVTAVTIDTFTFAAGANATVTGSVGGSAMTGIINSPYNLFVTNVASFSPNGCSVVWEYSYKSQSTRTMSPAWYPMSPLTTLQTPSEAVIDVAGDLQVRATFVNDRDNLSPSIDGSGFGAILVSPRVDSTANVFNYVSQNIKFDNPTTHARFIVSAKLPGTSGMKLFIKEIDTVDQDVAATAWVQLTPNNPITNSSGFVEYEYSLDGTFIGYKIMIQLTGANTNPPALLDIRTIAFA